MTRKLCTAILCLALAAVCVPAFADYVIQAESVLDAGSGWFEPAPGNSWITRGVVEDVTASGGQALRILDDVNTSTVIDDVTATADNAKFFYQKMSADVFGASATMVVRAKTGDAAAFSGTYGRNVILTFKDLYNGTTKKSVGLCLRPDRTGIVSTNPSSAYGEVTSLDNSVWTTWTVVATNTGKNVSVYRNGVFSFSADTGTSTVDGVLATPTPVDSVAFASSPAAMKGEWFYDYIAVKPGVDPAWNPVPEPSSIAALSLGLLGVVGLRRRVK